ncbi:MAG: peptidylprolyl isomerase [Patescibacteria group bacterium]
MNSTKILIALLIIIIAGLIFWPKPKPVTTLMSSPLPSPSTPTAPLNQPASVTLKTTAGDITIELDTKNTPITANNFITLAQKGFYDNTIFHRVIKGFMIQGGDPKGDGTGSPGYKFNDEPFAGEYIRGAVAMANSGPNTNGSQFFIMHADYALPKNYVIFGQVTAGLDVVDKIATSPVTANSFGEPSQPVNPISVLSVSVL